MAEQQILNISAEDFLNQICIQLSTILYCPSINIKNMDYAKLVNTFNQISLLLIVQCKNCKSKNNIEIKTRKQIPQQILISKQPCSKCLTKNMIVFKQQTIHQNSDELGLYGSETWDLIDILQCDLEFCCGQCQEMTPVENYIAGQLKHEACRFCFFKFQFSFVSFQRKSRNEFLEIQGNKPLQSNGICLHDKFSFRNFRFACCGKNYSCQQCHDNIEKHKADSPINMICGFCSDEQKISNICQKCAKNLTKNSKSKKLK